MLAFTGLFAAVIHVALAPLMLLTSLGRFREHAVLSRLTAWAISSLAASLLALLVIAAIVGVLMLFTTRTRLHALMALSRSLMLAVLVLSVPFVFRLAAMGPSMEQRVPWLTLLPPAWFVGFERALLGTSDPWLMRLAIIAAATFLVSAAIVAGSTLSCSNISNGCCFAPRQPLPVAQSAARGNVEGCERLRQA